MNEIFKALADPTRRHILKMLGEHDLTAGDIAKAFNISAPSISHHLSILKTAGLVEAERDGQNIVYSLNTTVMHDFMGEMMDFFRVGELKDEHKNPDTLAAARSDSSDGGV